MDVRTIQFKVNLEAPLLACRRGKRCVKSNYETQTL